MQFCSDSMRKVGCSLLRKHTSLKVLSLSGWTFTVTNIDREYFLNLCHPSLALHYVIHMTPVMQHTT